MRFDINTDKLADLNAAQLRTVLNYIIDDVLRNAPLDEFDDLLHGARDVATLLDDADQAVEDGVHGDEYWAKTALAADALTTLVTEGHAVVVVA